MTRDRLGALIILVFSLAYGYFAFDIPLTHVAQKAEFNARTMPFALAVIGIILSMLILVLPPATPGGRTPVVKIFRGLDWKRLAWLVGLMVAYAIGLYWLGFIFSSILFLIGGFMVLGERRWLTMILFALPLVMFIWFMMSYVLGMYISPGEIFYLLGVVE